ncbi:MAG: hypothetical protein WC505_01690 [Patescibacteria group bacterium]
METKRKNQNELLVDASRLVSYCPLCDAPFYPEQVAVIEEDSKVQLLHATCNACAASLVILLLMNDRGVNSVGLVTDLTGADVAQFKNGEPITSNTVLDVSSAVRAEDAAGALF